MCAKNVKNTLKFVKVIQGKLQVHFCGTVHRERRRPKNTRKVLRTEIWTVTSFKYRWKRRWRRQHIISALEVIFNAMRSIDPRITYLLYFYLDEDYTDMRHSLCVPLAVNVTAHSHND